MKKTQINQAMTFGMIAFENGKMRVPAQDGQLINMMNGREIGQTPEGEASSINLIKSWCAGWDTAKRLSMAERVGF
jgi:hypothetical protein